MQALLDAMAQLTPGGDARRVFHGRGGLHPGLTHWTLDAYPPVWLLTCFGVPSPDEVAHLRAAFVQRSAQWAPDETPALVLQARRPGGAGVDTTCVCGAVPEPHTVTEDGARYQVHLMRGQNHGLFLDMANGRRWLRAHAAGARVLNLFAYTCAFSVAALQGGAQSVLNVDMASGALATGQQNHALNGLSGRARFLSHDIFKSWGKLTRNGPYDIVVVDPPSYQKGSFVAGKDYPRLMRRLPDLLAPDGQALLCLNAPELPSAFLQGHMQTEAPALQWVQRLPNPDTFADTDPERALKVLIYRAPATG